MDYRSNLTSSICSDARSSCPQTDFFIDFATNSLSGAQQTDFLSRIPTAGNKLVFFDVIRLSLYTVLSQIKDVEIGLMMSHDNSTNCVGQSAINCSNGSFVLRGFEPEPFMYCVRANDSALCHRDAYRPARA